MDIYAVTKESGDALTLEVHPDDTVLDLTERICGVIATNPFGIELRLGAGEPLDGSAATADTELAEGDTVVVSRRSDADMMCTTLTSAEYIYTLALSACGLMLFLGLSNQVQVWGTEEAVLLNTIPTTNGAIRNLAASTCLTSVYSAGDSGLLESDIVSGSFRRRLAPTSSFVRITQCNAWVVSATAFSSSISVFLRSSGVEVRRKEGLKYCAGLSLRGDVLATAHEREVCLWDIGLSAVETVDVGGEVVCMDVSGCGKNIVVVLQGCSSGHLWRIDAPNAQRTLKCTEGEESVGQCDHIFFTPCGGYVLGCYEGLLLQWDAATGVCVNSIKDANPLAAVSPCSRYVIYEDAFEYKVHVKRLAQKQQE